MVNIGTIQYILLPGQYFDSETGLHYNYFRDYDPTIGRYIQSDPIGLDGGMNTFSYVGSNPIMIVDRSGLLDPHSTAHTMRNRLNRCPEKSPGETNLVDCEGNKWVRDSWFAERYHGGHLGYKTYRVSKPKAGWQCTYDLSNNVVHSGPYQGTYDYAPPPGPYSPSSLHDLLDVTPHEQNPNYVDGLTDIFDCSGQGCKK